MTHRARRPGEDARAEENVERGRGHRRARGVTPTWAWVVGFFIAASWSRTVGASRSMYVDDGCGDRTCGWCRRPGRGAEGRETRGTATRGRWMPRRARAFGLVTCWFYTRGVSRDSRLLLDEVRHGGDQVGGALDDGFLHLAGVRYGGVFHAQTHHRGVELVE